MNLAHTRRIYQDVADRAEKENRSYRDFLALLLAEEVAHRKQTRLQRFTRKAHFPFFKTTTYSLKCAREAVGKADRDGEVTGPSEKLHSLPTPSASATRLM